MSLPVVAIIGRPNVGKSSLLNALAGRRVSIVDPTPGVTRDRISTPVELDGGWVEMVDTGGMGIEDVDDLTDHVEDQIRYAVAEAALILFVVDTPQGVMPLDEHVARTLRRENRNVILVANKLDSPEQTGELGSLHTLGFGDPMPVSATLHLGLAELRAAIAQRLGPALADKPPDPLMKLAIVGKRNAGKSTFINALTGQQRVIVSERPGTTRDSVDVRVDLDGRTFLLIDTAGLRKASRRTDDIEYYTHHRALRSIRRANVVALFIDATVPIASIDKHLAGEITSQFKPTVLVVSKWDLAGDTDSQAYLDYFAKTFPELAFAPVSLTSAITGQNLRETVALAAELFVQTSTRIPTAELNQIIEEIAEVRGPRHKGGTKPPKIFYASQVATNPPTIVCVVNDIRSFEVNYERFLANQLRERGLFAEVPIRILFRPRSNRNAPVQP